MRNVYLDHAATTPVRHEVMEAMLPFFSQAYGNPSSLHGAAGIPREALDRARSGIAGVLGCRPAEIIFTGGGTESDNLAILGIARAARPRGHHIIISQIEHHAVLNACHQLEREGFRVTYLPVDSSGLVNLEALEKAIDEGTILVSIMLANNEIGTVQPIAEISRLVRSRGILFHTDAVQAAGFVDLDVERLGVDALSVSAHKLYGPKGAGMLYVRRGTPLDAVAFGGDQERGRRSGTENVPAIVGLAVALLLAEQERVAESRRLVALRDRLISSALHRIPGIHLTGHATLRLPGNASFYLDGVTAEAVLIALDERGIACASGSACRAGSTDPSHVLLALGLPATLARNGLRLTLGRDTSEEDIAYVLDALQEVVTSLQSGGVAVA